MNGKFIVYGLSLIVMFFVFTIYDRYQLKVGGYTIYGSEATSSSKPIDIGYSRIDPLSPIYFLKTVREDLEMMVALTPRVKLLRELEFATRRLREAKTLLEKSAGPFSGKNEDLIPPTLERYNSQINSIQSEKLKDQEIIGRIKESLVTHIDVLQKMYVLSKNLRTKMFIRSSMNKLVSRSDVENSSKMSICNLFLKEASSSSLNQAEQVILKDRGQICLDSIKILP